MAFVPDKAIEISGEISPNAFRLYIHFCRRRNKHSGGWWFPKDDVLREVPGISEPTYFRLKKELVEKKWIEVSSNFVRPLIGFEVVKNDDKTLNFETEDNIRNDSNPINNESFSAINNDNPTIKNESAAINNESENLKNDSQTIKNESVYKEYQSLPVITKQVTKNNQTEKEDFENQNLHVGVGSENQEPEPDPENQKQAAQDPELSESSGSGSQAKAQVKVDVQTVFDQWRKITDHPKAKLDPKREKRIRNALKDFSVEDLFTCLEGWQSSEYHRGKNATGTVYDKVETIFRDNSQIESFIDRVVRPSNIKPPDDSKRTEFEYAPVTFADIMDLQRNVYKIDEDHQTLFDRISSQYLSEHSGEKEQREVKNYASNHGLQQR